MIRYLVAILMTFATIQAASTPDVVRQPVVAGRFYPSQASELRQLVAKHLEAVPADCRVDGELIALIVPHAGLVYSGAIAAHAFSLLENSEVDKVILCGPSHRHGFPGSSVYGPGVIWKSPLGNVKCHSQLCQSMLDRPGIEMVPAAHLSEHCLEVQLPYLQTVLDQFSIVPVALGYQSAGSVNQLADALVGLPWDDRTVMVASSDWQHYHPASEGWPMDSLGLACLLALDPDRLQAGLENKSVEACGGGAAVAATKAALARGANRAKLLKYGDSGDISGDKSSVVGYAALAIYRAPVSSSPGSPAGSDSSAEKQVQYSLSRPQETTLLRIARQSIDSYLQSGGVPDFEVDDHLSQPGAAFVTLKKAGHLRGCIGYTQAVEPLYQTVSQCAVAAAVNDRRFPPVALDEMKTIDIEISVLTPLQEVSDLTTIKVGRDGLMIVLGNRRGLLLPQVATDYGWSREQFLASVCRKAGLSESAYLDPKATIYSFRALIFGEK